MENSCNLNDSLTNQHSIQREELNSAKLKVKYPFGHCRVCNDKATGVHYGIATCEGCKVSGNSNICIFIISIHNHIFFNLFNKGFFKRSIIKGEYYRCFFNNKCDLTPKTRNRCKDCRFKKCLEVGMSLDGIKMGRIPKKQKEMALEKLDVNSNMMSVDEEIKMNQLETSDSSSPSNSNQYKSEREAFNSYSSDECEKSMAIYEKTNDDEKATNENTDDSMTRFLNSLNPYLVSVTEKNIDLFPKSNKQPSERDTLFSNFINTNKSLKSSNILPNLNFSKLYMNNQTYDSNYFIISSLINDKIYQLYIEHSKRTNSYYDKSVKLSQNRSQQLKGHDCSLKEIWNALIESIPEFVKSVILFAREIPGLNEISNNDFSIIINNRLFDFYIIMNSVLFINGESYMYLKDDIVYTREWHNKIKGKEKTDSLFEFAEFFNSLNFTIKEKALLIAYVFTLPGIFSIASFFFFY